MGQDGGDDDYDLSESLGLFRGAGNSLNEAVKHLYFGGRKKVQDLHYSIQIGIALGLWFGGNWVYNQIKRPVLDFLKWVAGAIPVELLVSPRVGLSQAVGTSVWVQILGMLAGVIIAQNRRQTQKLMRIKSEVESMNGNPEVATDGGRRKSEKPKGAGLGGAIAGGFAGASFGPGGVLAGAFLGYIIGEGMRDEQSENDSIEEDLGPYLQNRGK